MTDAQTPPPRRRRPAGGYAKADETREKMILAALRVFADDGFEKASTRRIAAEAGVTPPVLQYHFDSKEGLHRACGDYLVAQVMGRLAPVLERTRQARDAETAVEVLCELMTTLSSAGMGRVNMAEWKLFMARADADTDGPARAIVEAGVAQPIMRAALLLVARALDLPPESEEARLRAMLLMGQVSVVTARRQRTLDVMGWSEFDEAAQATVNRILVDNVRRLTARD
ncbi:TetR/AcrR family transcriptional regulator [Caulobacter hibisci]|uniref:CerR family C-terminal domain-containing protein n=1 Tax=Caulobacter hibisci TaxID=2035993 RepID=A0ABS0SW18_9CAUL|nr:TetR/AcrR family transcriptional regulator [Caulobacter hibisci]MBI1683794.1 CerR family C-terminal domain-containing protein [Caulobacter hibisci]